MVYGPSWTKGVSAFLEMSLLILAQGQAADCRLCRTEIKDIVEYLIDADHKTAFLMSMTARGLLGNVAVENGWPCEEVLSRK